MFLLLVSSFLIFLEIVAVGAQVDFSLQCQKGYRVSGIKRTKTHYSVLGSLSIECEQKRKCLYLQANTDKKRTILLEKVDPQKVKVVRFPATVQKVNNTVIARPEQTRCSNEQSIPKCTGLLEGCGGDSWLGGLHAFLLENSTQALVLDPVCCSSQSVHLNTGSCIHDQLNAATKDFSHSLTYRGLQCWHQYNTNHTLVDLLWKMEICPFESDDFPVVITEVDCEECHCICGIQQCASGAEPVRIIHKKRTGRCGCECDCTYKCINFN